MSVVEAPSYDGDLFSDEAIREPYGLYARIRAAGAAVWLPALGMYALGRYADARGALADHGACSSASGVALNDVTNEVLQGTLLASDPPLHDHLRKVVAHRLTPRALRGREAAIGSVADALVESLLLRDSFDGVPDVAQAMPMSVVPDFLGWPERGRERLIDWASGALQALGPIDQARTRAGFPLAQEMAQYTFGLAAERDLLPDSLGASLLEAADRGEIEPAQCPMLLIDYLGPSIETTASALGHALALFARHPDQWQMLRDRPELIPAAVNEVVRYETPLRMFSRMTTRDLTCDEVIVPSGSRILVMFASANRDERKWDRPDVFDVTRDAADQLGFGYGIHGCAGQGLARMEIQAILRALASRVDRIELTGEPTFAVNNMLRVHESLPMRLVAA
jgi:cytochrome P450